jgi:hypothetical protein
VHPLTELFPALGWTAWLRLAFGAVCSTGGRRVPRAGRSFPALPAIPPLLLLERFVKVAGRLSQLDPDRDIKVLHDRIRIRMG